MAVPEIDIEQLHELHAGGVPLIDVRRPDEYTEFHVPGALLFPLDELGSHLDDIPRDRTVYVICKSGGRSARAVEALNQQGFDAVNVAGGSDAWRTAGHPVESGEE